MSRLPQVAIVGRMNVGKSTLFNRLSNKVKSLTLDFSGVTRDVIKDRVSWLGRDFDLIDTGGISFKKSEDRLQEAVRQKALDALENADVVLFVVDGVAGILSEDEEIAHELRRRGIHTILVVNKEDVRAVQENALEFYSLFHDELVLVSAQHGRGIGDLLSAIINALPDSVKEVKDEPLYRVVFIGRPNVGKSSLLNLLLKQERAIVSDIPGTTREAISERIAFSQEHLLITDTPGIRRSRAIDEDLESLMVKSSFKAVKDADVVVLLIDASEAGLVDQELKLAFYAFSDLYKALVVLVNKSDLLDPESSAAVEESFARYAHLMRKVEVMQISCKTEKNIGRVLPLVKQVWEHHSLWMNADELSFELIDSLKKITLVRNRQRLEIYRVKQLDIAPVTILLNVNLPQFFGQSQKSFLDTVVRKKYDLKGAPIKFIIAGR
ncbi:TPA: ribosome biogenesis GTPase Der [Candidatus Dependentiae bacterium]|nr:MAG: GTPase Der [candidate division TM6 bacterium GW2011_GWF2_43_87]HBL98598.1 ribosome biogenesis GTPase Der [Candidatus Dependentiae bacterium]